MVTIIITLPGGPETRESNYPGGNKVVEPGGLMTAIHLLVTLLLLPDMKPSTRVELKPPGRVRSQVTLDSLVDTLPGG